MADQIEALNGPIEVGDRVAVARSEGRGAGMSIGTVLEIDAPKNMAGQYKRTNVKVRVDRASGMRGHKFDAESGSWVFQPYTRVFRDPKHIVKLPPLVDQDAKALLGQQVTVTLNRPERGPAAVSRGQLLGFGDGGEVEILADDGFVHHCWPMLDIKPRESR